LLKVHCVFLNRENKVLFKMIPVFKPLIEKEEIQAAVESLEMGWLGMGSYVKEFEDAIHRVCELEAADDRHVVAVSTGHAALHLALMSMGVTEGDEVITPSFNNAADFQAIKACGADPVFVDILEDTLCVDPNKIESLISKKTKCIIAMDYDLLLCDHDALKDISNRTGIPILHDAAHSFGSRYNGKPTGNQHDYTMFSFDPVKAITCIDGGALVVKGREMVEKLQAMRLIGMTQPAAQMYKNSRAWTYDIKELGFRYHMANLHAAIGLQQIGKLNLIMSSRQMSCNQYNEALSKANGILIPKSQMCDINPFLYYIRVLYGRREELRTHLRQQGVDTGIHWQAGHSFSLFSHCKTGPLDVTEKIVSEVLSLPLHSKMNALDVERICRAVLEFK
jgi:dTDP-4-amino-4,6-dideoxygalactose transaminase